SIENTANVEIALKDDDGLPLTVDLDGEEVAGETQVAIAPKGLRVLATDGRGGAVDRFGVGELGSAAGRCDRLCGSGSRSGGGGQQRRIGGRLPGSDGD
ncbi:MAG: hypothetical protein V3T83_03260, partial [Acidobacteriota bacterium]